MVQLGWKIAVLGHSEVHVSCDVGRHESFVEMRRVEEVSPSVWIDFRSALSVAIFSTTSGMLFLRIGRRRSSFFDVGASMFSEFWAVFGSSDD
jgi:hypothetical protein